MGFEYAAMAGICLLVMLANLAARRGQGAAGGSGLVWRGISEMVARLSWGDAARFQARNPLHRLATALILAQICLALLTRSNASAAMQVDLSAHRVMAWSLFYLALALLGPGWLTRRDLAGLMKRLELRWPTAGDVMAGLALALALFMLAQAGMALWASSLPEAAFETQTAGARQVFALFVASLPTAIVLALATALGEELLFRGALQPIFGIGLSSLVFVSFHGQLLFTPGALILFGVSLAFGWLKRRRGTSAAVICHAVYNLLPALLHWLAV